VFGGQNGSGNNTQIYNPVSNVWYSDVVLPLAEYWTTGAAVNGNIYVIGGENGGNNNQIFAPGSYVSLFYFTAN
jgi:hypothetical protein